MPVEGQLQVELLLWRGVGAEVLQQNHIVCAALQSMVSGGIQGLIRYCRQSIGCKGVPRDVSDIGNEVCITGFQESCRQVRNYGICITTTINLFGYYWQGVGGCGVG